jgi:hypothetical protein
MPIGSGAQYTPANLGTPQQWFTEEEFIYLDPNAPVRTLSGGGHAWPASCTGGSSSLQVRIRDGATIPGGGPPYAPNNTGGVLLHNNTDLVQEFLASCRNNGTGTLYAGWFLCQHSLKGSGVGPYCGHGGSGLSAVGGSLRQWELAPGTPIRHTLKLTLPAATLSGNIPGQSAICDNGYRWPAQIADGGWDGGGSSRYAGQVPTLCMGSLLALSPSVNCNALVAAELSRRICAALRDYGAYVVDIHPTTSSWRPFTINLESGNDPLNGTEMIALFQQLQVVMNNSQSSVGGGGTPRVPLAPPIGN